MRRPTSRIAVFSILLVAIIVFLAISYAWNTATEVFQPANAHNTKAISITVSKGETTAEIADDLQNKGLIRNALAFRAWARIKGLDTQLEPGVYNNLTPSMTISDITDQLLNAQPAEAVVLVKEGWRLEQIAHAFADTTPKLVKFNPADFLKYTKNVDQFPDAKNQPLLSILPQGQKSLEGLLFPATYEVPIDADANYVVDLLLKTMNNTITGHLTQQASQHQMSPYQLLIISSIVERETATPKYRGHIASVYWNRTFSDAAKTQTAGFIQADPTVQYAADTQSPPKDGTSYWTALQDSPANIATNSPWNTYTKKGLPPTPICSPGLASLSAVASPDQTDDVYFFAGKDGQTHFTKTLNEFTKETQAIGISN